ncbi:type I polyketide synthase, partial [Streptomyces graminis]|uniref:type I polyketide synthase n=1 Tax=Streptomyces graminis TaxID=1464081 RepID=UPI00052799A5
QALANAQVSAADVDVVEAHGTGTSLGDPIEAQALLATYGQERTGDRPLWLGSVKSNLGHTQAAAGVAGVIKMVAAMQHGRLPKTLHAETPSSHVDWSSGEVELLTEPREWPCGERPRRAGVSAFGVSGTNAHAIIEEAPLPEGRAEAGQAAQTDEAADAAAPEVHLPLVPWVVSAKTASGVAAQAGRLLAAVDGHRTVDVGLSLGATRTGLEHRAIVLGGDAEELRTQLAALAAGERVPGMARTGLTGFVFAGQGGQRLGMGRELAAVFPVFAAALDEVCAGFDGLLDRSLREVMFADADADADAAAEALGLTGWAQPALFAVEVALFRLVESWGVTPDYLVGHSVGELAAAHVSGVLPLGDACRLVAARARLMQALPGGGAMWAVRATVDEVAPLLVEDVSVAAVNAPGQVVLSGERAAVEAVAARLPERKGRWLQVSHAFHSALMDPMLEEFGRVADGIEMRRPEMPIVSTLTGELIEEFSASYWADQVRGTVRFADAITRLKSLGVARFVTLGPDAGLVGAVEETYGDETLAVSLLGRDRPEPHTAVTALARLWADGGPVDWAAFYAPTGARTVDLPTYAFQRSRYWPRPRTAEQDAEHGVDADLWNAIERGDAEALAAELGVDLQSPMDEVLPALSAWRRRHEERASLDRLRYQVSWTPVGLGPAPVPVTAGGWLLVESAGALDVWADALAGELASRGVRVERLRLGAGELDRAGLAERLAQFSGCGTVVSFLGQDEASHAEHVRVPLGLVGTVALVQAVADAGLDVRVWCVTSGAVSVVSGEGLRRPLRAGVWGLGRVVALEEPDRWGGLVDVPVEPVRARLSGGGVWLPSGTVLVTGGTGALGARVARWVVERGAGRVVLA